MAIMFYILFVILLIILIIYKKLKQQMSYWKQKNVPHEEPVFLFGNYKDYFLQRTPYSLVDQELCRKFHNQSIIGSYFGTTPTLIVQDPEIIKLVLTQDFYYFSGREISNYTQKEPLTRNMFFTYGDRWRVLRQNSMPLFAYGKLKDMFYLIKDTANAFEQFLQEEAFMSEVIEVKTLMSRYTIDCICSCAFGCESKTMDKSITNNPFITVGNSLFNSSRFWGFKLALRAAFPSIFYGIGMQLFPDAIPKFFNELLFKEYKRRDYKPTSRNDFVDLLLHLKNLTHISGDSIENLKGGGTEKVKVKVKADDELLAAMSELIFAAGYETSSSTSSYALYELAKNTEKQDIVLREVDEYLSAHGGVISYDCITELPYLTCCVDETLRLYPVLAVINREVYHEYTLPNGVKLDKGVRVHLPMYHVQRNPKYFVDPESFIPERFAPENKDKIIPFTFLPFGEGPRICIGFRFGKMMVMAGLITVLRRFRVDLAEDTPKTLTMNPLSQLNNPVEMIKLKFIERSKLHT